MEVEDALNLGRWRWIDATPAGGGVYLAMMDFCERQHGSHITIHAKRPMLLHAQGESGCSSIGQFADKEACMTGLKLHRNEFGHIFMM